MLALCLCFGVVLIDQLAKHFVWSHFAVGQSVPVIKGLFSITYVRNTGAAWGMFSGMNMILIWVSIIMLSLIIIFRRQIISDMLIQRVALGLMTAGIIGNLLDRIRVGYVIDFLDFYWRTHPTHFPAFNVADTAICTGVGLYLLSQIHDSTPSEEKVATTGSSIIE